MRRLFKYLILAMSKLKKTCIYSFSFCYRIRHHHLQKEISHVKLRILLDLVRFCLFPLIILGKLFLANSRKGIFFLGDILQLRRCLSLRFFIPFIFIGLLVSLLDDHTLLIDTTIKTLRALLMRSSGLSLLSNLAQTSTCMRRHHCWITHPPTLRRQSKIIKGRQQYRDGGILVIFFIAIPSISSGSSTPSSFLSCTQAPPPMHLITAVLTTAGK